MSKSKRVELQATVQNQDQWEELLQKSGLIVVDAYSAWCGPCKAAVSTLKRIKNELGDNLLHFAVAETDNIDSLSLYKGKSQPTFLFYANGTLVYVIRGCNCPVIIKTVKDQLEREHKVLDGKFERIEYVDKEVGMQPSEEKKDEENEDVNEEDEETAARMTESMMKASVSFKDVDKPVSNEVSLAIIKPDAVKAGLVDDIIAKVEAEGMEILRKEERTLTKEEAAEFYKQHEGSEHFEDLVEFMSSGPCMTLIISKSKGESGDGVIPQIRDLIGPKDINLAKEQAPTSIRALYGTSAVQNAIHACDTSESAARELAFFYPGFVSPGAQKKKTRPESRTLALIRPDALKHHKDSIIAKVKEAGFSIAMAKELTLTREEAEDFYSEHKGKDFYEALVNNMCSGPVMALCLAKDDAVEGWRNMLGPKEMHVAVDEAPDSLRAQFKVDDSDFNPLHGSDSSTAANREIQKIFPVQTTVAVIKPDTAAEKGDAIIDKIKESGFRIVSKKDVGLTKELASQFYHEHSGKDFFDGLTDYMSSGQSTVLLLEREDAVTGWRAMMGPTDPNEARETNPESIRAMFGKDIVRNAVHGSSDMTKAGKVIDELFPEIELNLENGKVQDDGSQVVPEDQATEQDQVSAGGGEQQGETTASQDQGGATDDQAGGTEQVSEGAKLVEEGQDGQGGEAKASEKNLDGDTDKEGKDGQTTTDGDAAIDTKDTSQAGDAEKDEGNGGVAVPASSGDGAATNDGDTATTTGDTTTADTAGTDANTTSSTVLSDGDKQNESEVKKDDTTNNDSNDGEKTATDDVATDNNNGTTTQAGDAKDETKETLG